MTRTTHDQPRFDPRILIADLLVLTRLTDGGAVDAAGLLIESEPRLRPLLEAALEEVAKELRRANCWASASSCSTRSISTPATPAACSPSTSRSSRATRVGSTTRPTTGSEIHSKICCGQRRRVYAGLGTPGLLAESGVFGPGDGDALGRAAAALLRRATSRPGS